MSTAKGSGHDPGALQCWGWRKESHVGPAVLTVVYQNVGGEFGGNDSDECWTTLNKQHFNIISLSAAQKSQRYV